MVTFAVAEPFEHDRLSGSDGRWGWDENRHVIAPTLVAVSVTVPPAAGRDVGVTTNDETFGEEADPTVTATGPPITWWPPPKT